MRTLIHVAMLALVACGGGQSVPPPVEPAPEAPVAAKATPEAAAPSKLPLRKDDAERGSKNGRTTSTIGGVEVVVEYGRPSQKGRTLFGELVPYGQVWRTGADEATVLSVSGDVMVGDKPLDAGVYGLFSIPGEKEWTIIVNKVAGQWGAYEYKASEDVLRVTVPTSSQAATEVFTIDATDKGLSLSWGETRVDVPITSR